ncbi:MAG: hypothetical protein JNK58_07755 [Phycisphaerae bacterium]|nr:hypothetical protein [Phycisphaerae bacterium]
MNFRSPKAGSRLDPSGLRLPLIALIDVILFLLMYFMFAGSLDADEAELRTAIRAEQRAGRGTPEAGAPIIDVSTVNGRPLFRVGAHRLNTRDELTAVLTQLPNLSGAIIRVSNGATVGTAAAAAQACTDAGFDKISYLPGDDPTE